MNISISPSSAHTQSGTPKDSNKATEGIELIRTPSISLFCFVFSIDQLVVLEQKMVSLNVLLGAISSPRPQMFSSIHQYYNKWTIKMISLIFFILWGPSFWTMIVDQAFSAKSKLRLTFTLLYVTTLGLFRFSFQFLPCHSAVLMLWLGLENLLVRVWKRSFFGLKCLFWSVQTWLEMAWHPQTKSEIINY